MIDYKIGDWVETCHMLPGIVQKIDEERDEVLVFSFESMMRCAGNYCGGSTCSIHHCGVHKITYDYALKLLSIGEERLAELWNEAMDGKRDWPEIVEEEFAKRYNRAYDRELYPDENS